MPRFDSASVFGRLLDWKKGGFCSLAPAGEHSASRRYLPDTLVLETTFRAESGSARVFDCFTMRSGGRQDPFQQLLRVVDGLEGTMDFELLACPRFDYGGIQPWIRAEGPGAFSALGGAAALVLWSDARLEPAGHHDLHARFPVSAGERVRTSIHFALPETLDNRTPKPPEPTELDRRLEQTVHWWDRWAKKGHARSQLERDAMRSALVLKGLTNAPTGAICAAPTTSLPESLEGNRNWDYRFSWIRDSAFTLASLAELGYVAEADGFRRFVERSAAGSAQELQVMYGVGGEHRLTEHELEDLEGYRGVGPVRVGNAAYAQTQLDVYGALLEIAWRWHQRGHSPSEDYWKFLVELVETASRCWTEPDRGIWEVRGEPRHFVQSKVMCWVALDRGISLALATGRTARVHEWTRTRDGIRAAVMTHGYNQERTSFVQAFGTTEMDAALLLLPNAGFVDWADERMVGTVAAIRTDLEEDGLILRYRTADGLEGGEGRFLCCSFWMAECLARQGQSDEARAIFDKACGASNDLGLFSEEYDPATGLMLGNFPQGLTHLSHIEAALALRDYG